MLIGIPIAIGGIAWAYSILISDRANDTYDKEDPYNKLFRNLKLLEDNEWVKYLGTDQKKAYDLMKFEIAESVSVLEFIKVIDIIAEKMDCLVIDKENNKTNYLSIYYEGEIMYFRKAHKEIEHAPFTVLRPPTNDHILLGFNFDYAPVWLDLSKEPNWLLGGVVRCGKSTLTHGTLINILANEQGYLFMCDRKHSEFGYYRGKKGVVEFGRTKEECEKVITAFKEFAEKRMKVIEEENVRNYLAYNSRHPEKPMKRFFLIIDEINDIALENIKKDEAIGYYKILISLASKLGYIGGSIYIGCQRPSATVIRGDLKCNFVCIGMRTINEGNSKIILDEVGLESLPIYQARGRFDLRMNDILAYHLTDQQLEAEIAKLPNNEKVQDK